LRQPRPAASECRRPLGVVSKVAPPALSHTTRWNNN
jgi:hypothetical protein